MIYANVVGRLGADAELKTSKSGKQYVSMRIASNEYVNGETVTTWVGVVWHGERALKMREYFKKGSMAVVWGTLRNTLYDNKNGEKAISVDVYADRVDFGPSSSSSAQTNSDSATASTGTFHLTTPTPTAAAPQEVAVTSNADDDLPF